MLGLITLLCASCVQSGDVYKVENVGDVPRLTINGTPSRARMLYVSPTYFMLGSPSRRTAYQGWVETFVEIPALEKSIEGVFEIKPREKIVNGAVSLLEIIEDNSGKKVWELQLDKLDPRASATNNGKVSFGVVKDRKALIFTPSPVYPGYTLQLALHNILSSYFDKTIPKIALAAPVDIADIAAFPKSKHASNSNFSINIFLKSIFFKSFGISGDLFIFFSVYSIGSVFFLKK
jgi:hypothetical protein